MSFCSGGTQATQNTQNQNQWANPLGAASIGANGTPTFIASGAPQLGAQALSYLGSSMPQMNQAGQAQAAALQSAAAAPGWTAAQGNATNTAAGDYLAGSPQLNSALAHNQAVAGAAAADQVARQQSEMAKNGMAWGTPAQQAAQSTVAGANAAAANTNAQAYQQNYMAERAAQGNAGNMLAQAQGAPLSYLGQVPGAYASGPGAAAGLISGLGSGGSIFSAGQNQQNAGVTSPSTGSDILNTIGSL